MTVLGKHNYRIAFKFGGVGEYWQDYETKNTFQFPSGVALKIQVGILKTEKPEVFYNLSQVASLKLEIKALKYCTNAPGSSDPAYMPKEIVNFDSNVLESADWQSGMSQHITFEYTAAETALLVGEYWMVISGVLNDGSVISPGWGKMEIIEDGTGPESTTAPLPTGQYSAATVDSLLATKVAIVDIVNELTSTAVDQPLSAAQGKVLKDLIDAINILLASDTVSLDQLQEIVDYIQQNRSDLDALTISNIAGLQSALDSRLTVTQSVNITAANHLMTGANERQRLRFTNAAATTLTLIEFSAAGECLYVRQAADNSPTLDTLPAGMTVNGAENFEALTQHQDGCFLCVDATPGAQIIDFI